MQAHTHTRTHTHIHTHTVDKIVVIDFLFFSSFLNQLVLWNLPMMEIMAVISFILILKEIRLHLPSSAAEPSLLEARDRLESEDNFTSSLKSFRQKDTKKFVKHLLSPNQTTRQQEYEQPLDKISPKQKIAICVKIYWSGSWFKATTLITCWLYLMLYPDESEACSIMWLELYIGNELIWIAPEVWRVDGCCGTIRSRSFALPPPPWFNLGNVFTWLVGSWSAVSTEWC